MTEKFSVAAVHDMSGFGKCSLTVALPVLSAAGITVCPLPTAVLSAHTAYPDFVFCELTAFMKKAVAHWQKLEFKFDALYSGFLGSAEQIDITAAMIDTFKPAFAVVDPVMGDKGRAYATVNEEMQKKMFLLAQKADVLTPNLTEACILTGSEYKGEEISEQEAEKLCGMLSGLHCGNIVLTGVQRENRLYNYILTEDGQFFENSAERVGVMRHGTGDLFASVLTAALVRGFSLRQAAASAASFVEDALLLSREDESSEGADFEPLLYMLHSGLYMA